MIWFFCIFVLLLASGGGQAESVDLRGWTFTADLGGQWHSNPHDGGFVDSGRDFWGSWCGRGSWEGDHLPLAFYLGKDDAFFTRMWFYFPDILDPKQNNLTAEVDISVHKVPKELLNWTASDILADLNCFRFNSGNRIELDFNNWSAQDFLVAGGKRKDLEFNDHPALLIEQNESDVVSDDGKVIRPSYSIGRISILVVHDTVVSIDVVTRSESGLYAWDVIKKFTISPK